MSSRAWIPLSRNYGGVLSASAQPRGSLKKLEKVTLEIRGSSLWIKATGGHQGYDEANPLFEATVTVSDAAAGEETGAAAPTRSPIVVKEIQAEATSDTYTLEFALGLFEHNLFRARTLQIALRSNISGEAVIRSDTLSIDGFGYSLSLAEQRPEGGYRIGELVPFRLKVEGDIDCHARVHFEEVDEVGEEDEEQGTPPSLSTSEPAVKWAPGEREDKLWRVGCAAAPTDASILDWIARGLTHEQDSVVLDYMDPGDRGRAYMMRPTLELSQDGVAWYPIESLAPLPVSKPTLASFHLARVEGSLGTVSSFFGGYGAGWVRNEIRAEGKIDNLHESLPFELELSLWASSPMGDGETLTVERLGPYVSATVDAEGEFSQSVYAYTAATDDPQRRRIEGRSLFCVLTIPPSLTGTSVYLPVRHVLAHGLATLDASIFAPLEGEEAEGRHDPASSYGAVGVATEDLREYVLMSEHAAPSFARPSCDLLGMELVLRCDTRGDLEYWKGAAPFFLFFDGEEEVLRAEATPVGPEGTEWRTLSARLEMGLEAIVGRELIVRPAATQASFLFGEVEIEPFVSGAELPLDCRTRLEDPSYSDGKVHCRTHYFPTKLEGERNGKGLSVGFELDGKSYSSKSLKYAEQSYSQKDKCYLDDGMVTHDVGLKGSFLATISDAAEKEKIAAGSFRFRVYRKHAASGKVNGRDVVNQAASFATGSKTVIQVPELWWPTGQSGE